MKRLILMAALFVSLSAYSQTNVKQDSTGNFIVLTKEKEPATNTGKTFTDSKGNVWPVYKTASGKFYALRKSANGKEYKQYLKTS